MKNQTEKPIGVLDSGLGGLTVVRELERLFPRENIIYYGDNANCPYGNRSSEEILELSVNMLDFMKKQGVKTAAIACNTISVLIDKLRPRYDFPIISIIEAACENVADLGLERVGIFATKFTISQGLYDKLLRRLSPEMKVHGIPSPTLAALVDEAKFDSPATKAEAARLVSALREIDPETKHAVLGCTHYPVVIDLFEEAAPDINLINPAEAQAKAVGLLLEKKGLLSEAEKPRLDIYTSGERQQYEAAIRKLGIKREAALHIFRG